MNTIGCNLGQLCPIHFNYLKLQSSSWENKYSEPHHDLLTGNFRNSQDSFQTHQTEQCNTVISIAQKFSQYHILQMEKT